MLPTVAVELVPRLRLRRRESSQVVKIRQGALQRVIRPSQVSSRMQLKPSLEEAKKGKVD